MLELLPCGSASNLEVVVLELLQTTTVFEYLSRAMLLLVSVAVSVEHSGGGATLSAPVCCALSFNMVSDPIGAVVPPHPCWSEGFRSKRCIWARRLYAPAIRGQPRGHGGCRRTGVQEAPDQARIAERHAAPCARRSLWPALVDDRCCLVGGACPCTLCSSGRRRTHTGSRTTLGTRQCIADSA